MSERGQTGGAVTYLFEGGLGVEVGASGDLWGRSTFRGWALSVVLR